MTTTKETTQEVKVLDQVEDSSFGLIFTPATIEMTRYEEMKEVIESLVKKYDNQVITRELKKSAEQSRKELIALEKSIDEERKAVKRKYNEPLQVYEEQMKVLQNEIKRPLDKIREGLAEVEQGERDEREGILIRYLIKKSEEMKLPEMGIEVEQLQQPSWLNKGNFTQKGVGSKLAKEIDTAIELAVKEKQQREVNEQVVRSFCETVEVEPEAWISILDFHKPTEIIQKIQDIKKAEKERLERSEQEAKELAELEEKNAQMLVFEEYKEDVPEQLEQPTTAEIITDIIEVKGTKEQFQLLNEFMIANGIEVRAYDPFVIDDLPF